MTANRIYYAIALCVCVMSAYFVPNKITGVLLYAVIILPIVSFLLELFGYLSFTATQKTDRSSLYKNQSVRVSVFARCEFPISFAFLDVRMNRTGETKKVRKADAYMCASFGSQTAIGFDVACPYRGMHQVGAEYIRLYDLLGLFCLKKKLATCKVIVYPRVFPVIGLSVDSRLVGQTTMTINSLKRDDVLVSHVRKYQFTDRPKTIHWKLTSKMNELMVKSYEPLKEVGVIILLDLHKKDYDKNTAVSIEDKIVECGLSLTANCLGDTLTVRIVYFNNAMTEHHIDKIQDYPGIYNLLACIKFDGEIDINDSIKEIIEERTGGANLLVVTDRSDEQVQTSIKSAVISGYKPSLIRVVSGTDDEWKQELESLAKEGIDVVAVNASEGNPIVF